MNKKIAFLGLALAALSFSASAATSSTSLSNTSFLASECQVSVAQNLIFGSFDALNATTSAVATGSLRLNCSPGSVQIDLGTGLSPILTGHATWGHWNCQRAMKNAGGSSLPYQLGASAGTIGDSYLGYLGNPAPSNSCQGKKTTLSSVTFVQGETEKVVQVYGRIGDGTYRASVNTARVGSYSDSLTVTVSF